MVVGVLIAVQNTATAALAPASLACENRVVQLSVKTVVEGLAAVEGDVVEAEVPDGSIGHAVGGEGEDNTNGCTSKDVVPVVELVNGERTTDEDGTEDGDVGDDELPHGGVVVGEDLELGVEVQVEVDEASEAGGGVTGGETLKRIVDLLHVASTNLLRNVQISVASGAVAGTRNATLGGGDAGQIGLAGLEEVGTKAADEELDEDLEHGGADEGVEQADDGVVDIPEGADADLHEEDDDDGDNGGEEGSEPDGNDFVAHRVGELRVDNLTVGEGDGKGAVRGGRGHVDLMNVRNRVNGKGVDGGLTPRPMAPMQIMVIMSSSVPFSHCPKLGRRDMVNGSPLSERTPWPWWPVVWWPSAGASRGRLLKKPIVVFWCWLVIAMICLWVLSN